MLDHDVTKSAILSSGVSASEAGAASYQVIKDLTASILQQGVSVIIDSPCLYADLVTFGLTQASKASASYRQIECQLVDHKALDARLRSRATMPSQIKHLDQMFSHAGNSSVLARDLILEWAANMQHPPGDWLALDTSAPLSECVTQAMAFIGLQKVDG